SVVKKTVDTRFYPQVHVCLTHLDSYDFVTPGTTEVHICYGAGHTIPSGSGYKVAAPALSSSGCPADGGGVCPSDAAGVKADFENLTGDDIRTLASTRITFRVRDELAGQDMESTFMTGNIAFYGELSTHKSAVDLGASKDLFHTDDARAYCRSVVRTPGYVDHYPSGTASAILTGVPTGGRTSADNTMQSLHMGAIANVIHTGGDTNPEIFVSGAGKGFVIYPNFQVHIYNEYYDTGNGAPINGTLLPSALVFVNGSRSAATSWESSVEGADMDTTIGAPDSVAIGRRLQQATGWNLSDAYYVNNWPGTPYTKHKANGDSAYRYVTQVNYITGYICAASLH
ncbi:hypothetical protein XS87_25005, partial [Salmonella enterica subsp. enterica]|nr:hypothetical protein [Salmonella enterica subsp. enterica serovar Abaetetuba]